MNKYYKKDVLNLALYAGELMLRNGGETYRVEDVMIRICNTCGVTKAGAFVSPTSLMLTFDDGQDPGYTYSLQRSIKARDINMAKVSEINNFSRTFSPENMSVEAAMDYLRQIDSTKPYKIPIRIVLAGLATSGFTIASGGRINDMICAFFIGMIMFWFVESYALIEKNDFIRTLIASIIAAVLALICGSLGLCSNFNFILIGAVYILLPGIAITNAIRDAISGDLLSGLVRAFEAVIIAGSIAIGVGIVLNIYEILTGGVL